jgi:hypothetical protein
MQGATIIETNVELVTGVAIVTIDGTEVKFPIVEGHVSELPDNYPTLTGKSCHYSFQSLIIDYMLRHCLVKVSVSEVWTQYLPYRIKTRSKIEVDEDRISWVLRDAIRDWNNDTEQECKCEEKHDTGTKCNCRTPKPEENLPACPCKRRLFIKREANGLWFCHDGFIKSANLTFGCRSMSLGRNEAPIVIEAMLKTNCIDSFGNNLRYDLQLRNQ